MTGLRSVTSSTASAGAAEGGQSPYRHLGARLPRSARIRRTRDIQRVFRDGRRLRGSLVDVYMAASERPGARVCVIVPRFGRSAVARNRVRRRLTDIARREWLPLAAGSCVHVDLILKARPPAYENSYETLRQTLRDRFEALCSGS